eukprot:jgi/Chrpa1/11918/Chrysochromulina_OHIO_Genome00019805-RA
MLDGAFDVFDAPEDHGRASPETLLRALLGPTAGALAAIGVPPLVPDGGSLLTALPPELLNLVLCALPASGLASIDATARWCAAAVRSAVPHVVRRFGLLSMPERRLGESWACVAKRAELLSTSRNSNRVAAGFSMAAWIESSGELRVLLAPCDPPIGGDIELRTTYVPWHPPPVLTRRRGRSISCGALHMLVCLEDGGVVAVESTLGGGMHKVSWRELRTPPAHPADESVVHVACGAMHSLLVGALGTVWACGDNGFGQLGVGVGSADGGRAERMRRDELLHTEPHRVKLHLPAWQASGGGCHSLLLTHGGGVFSFGCGQHGRLGLGDEQHRAAPCAVPIRGGACACAVAAGGDYSIILLDSGDLVGFGCNHLGLLGSAPTADGRELLPRPVPLPALSGGGRPIVRQVSAGSDHFLALTHDGRVLSWGVDGLHAGLARPLLGGGGGGDGSGSASGGGGSTGDALWRRELCVGRSKVRIELVGALGHHQTAAHAQYHLPAIADLMGRCAHVAAGAFYSLCLGGTQVAGTRAERGMHEVRLATGLVAVLELDGGAGGNHAQLVN